jgi:hypothetical protein
MQDRVCLRCQGAYKDVHVRAPGMARRNSLGTIAGALLVGVIIGDDVAGTRLRFAALRRS